jgi:hypothetical protein
LKNISSRDILRKTEGEESMNKMAEYFKEAGRDKAVKMVDRLVRQGWTYSNEGFSPEIKSLLKGKAVVNVTPREVYVGKPGSENIGTWHSYLHPFQAPARGASYNSLLRKQLREK